MCRSLLALVLVGLVTGSHGASAGSSSPGVIPATGSVVVSASVSVADTTAPAALWAAYQAAPETPRGQEAAQTSLEAWAAAGQAEAFRDALREIPDSSELWARIDAPLREAIDRADDPTSFGPPLERLRERITSPEGWLTVMAVLGDFQRDVQRDRLAARDTYGEAVKYGGDPTLVRELSERLEQVRYPAVGETAPTFRAETMDGKTVSMKEMRGRPVLLYFWVPWCSPCVRKARQLSDALRPLQSEGLQTLAVVDDVRDVATTRTLIARNDLAGPHVDATSWDGSGPSPVETYGVRVPGAMRRLMYMVLIDESGVVAARSSDLSDSSALRDALQDAGIGVNDRSE